MTRVEYADEQIVVYPECPFNCHYCWDKLPIWQYRIKKYPPHPLEDAWKFAKAKKPRKIVISFSSDPYPSQEWTLRMTRQTLEVLLLNSDIAHTVMILTKNPDFALQRDIDLLIYDNVWLGTTLTSIFPIPDEPKAPSNIHRIQALAYAHSQGIKTWASIEPWLPKVTDPVTIIKETHRFVDWYVIGRLDYATQLGYPKIPKGWYKPQLGKVEDLLKSLGKPYHVKKQLRANL